MVSKAAGGTLITADGRLNIKVPSDAVTEDVLIRYKSLPRWNSTGTQFFHVFELQGFAVNRGNAPVSQFAKELQLTLKYAAADVVGLSTDTFTLAYFDPVQKQWVPLPSTVNRVAKTITAKTTHFTVLSATGESAFSTSIILDFQNDLHSGTAIAHYPLDVPPGPGGFRPDWELTYTSGVADEMKNRKDVGSWAGIGWTLHPGRIVANYSSGTAQYYLDLGGIATRLVQNASDGTWHTAPAESFFRITRNRVGGKDEWLVVTPDGTKYTFGDATFDGEAAQGNIQWCNVDECNLPSDDQPPSPYGKYRWDLSSVEDVHGNKMVVTMQRDFYKKNVYGQPVNKGVRSAYPTSASIQYLDGGVAKQTTLSFNSSFDGTESDPDCISCNRRRDNPTQAPPIVMDNKKLDSIEVKGDGTLVRKYQFTYSQTDGGQYAGNHALTSIIQFGADGTSQLPAVSLSYEDRYIYFHDPSQQSYTGNPGNPAWVTHQYLTSATTGYGGSLGFAYTGIPVVPTYESDPHTDNLWTRNVVQTRSVNPGLASPTVQRTMSYTGNPEYYVENSGWIKGEYRGFKKVRETDAANNYQEHLFFTTGQEMVNDPVYGPRSLNGDNLTGQEYQVEWYNPDNVLQRKTYRDWHEILQSSVYVQQVHNAYDIYGSKKIRIGFAYDSYNNVRREDQAGLDDTVADDRTVHRTFYPNTAEWVLRKPAYERVYQGITDDVGGSALKQETLYYYDGNASWSTSPTKGDLTKEERRKDESSIVARSFTYDAYGNPTGEQDENGRWTYHDYATTNILPSKKRYPPVGGLNLSEDFTWEFGTGKLATQTDVNAVTTTYRYDTFKRLDRTIRYGDSDASPTAQYQYPSWGTAGQQQVKALTKVNTSGATQWRSELFDGLGRVVQTHAQSEPSTNTLIEATVAYSNRGLLDKSYIPQEFLSSDVNGYKAPDGTWKHESYQYDALGRITQTTLPGGTITVSHAYSVSSQSGVLWEDLVTNERGYKTRYFYDAYGRLVKVQELDASQALYATTTYEFDVLGNLTKVTDAQGNLTTMSYDMLSRKTGMTDPDMGTWAYTYDAVGNLTQQTDGRNKRLSFEYDELNRMKAKKECTGPGTPPGCSTTTTLATYTYDDTTGGNYGKLRRTGMADALGSMAYVYDQRGRLTQETRTHESVAYTTSYTYDPDDLPASITYPDNPPNEVLTLRYNSRRLPTSGTSSLGQSLPYDTLYNPDGTANQLLYGAAGLQESFCYNGWDNACQSDLGPYSTLKRAIGKYGGTTIVDLKYGRDNSGNVTSRTDLQAGQTENFTYDALDRLTGSSGGPYAESYAYSQIGNLTGKDTASYAYTSGKPHAVGLITVPSSDLVSYWPLDSIPGGQVLDSVGANPGTVYNGLATSTDGAAGNSLSFDGTDDYVLVPDSNSLDVASITVSAWLKLTSDPNCDANNNWRYLLSKEAGWGNDTWHLILEENRSLTWSVRVGSGLRRLWTWGNLSLNVGQWYHLAATYDAASGDLKLYVDGALVGLLDEAQGNIEVTTNPVKFGINRGMACPDGWGTIPGLLDEVRVYSRALAADEVAALATFVVNTTYYTYDANGNLAQVVKGGTTRTLTWDAENRLKKVTDNAVVVAELWYDGDGSRGKQSAFPAPASGLVSYWKLDEGSGTTAADSAGTNTGTLINGPLWTDGQAGKALQFDGNDDYVQIPDSNSLDVASITVSAWLKLTSDPNCDGNPNWRYLLSKEAGWGNDTWHLILEENRSLTWSVRVGSGLRRLWTWGNLSLNVGQWYHLAATYDATSGDLKLYVDGALVGLLDEAPGSIEVTTNPVKFGINRGMACPDGWGTIPGLLDEVRVYSRALEETEVLALFNASTTLYVNRYYEKNLGTGEVTKYYYHGGRLVAFRKGADLRYVFTDALGSVVAVVDTAGNLLGKQFYKPYGEPYNTSGTLPTDKKYTGQKLDTSGLYFYNARYYDAGLARFISPDSLVPNPTNPQDLNRYSYVRNNPLTYTDPSGQCLQCGAIAIGAASGPPGWVVAGATIALTVAVAASPQAQKWTGFFSQTSMLLLAVAKNKLKKAAKGDTAGQTADPGGLDPNDPNDKDKESHDIATNKNWIKDSQWSKQFKTFKNQDAFVKEFGKAGEGREWHHIVEQRQANIDRFGAEAIYNTNNTVSVSKEINQKVADYYSSRKEFTGNLTVREWLGSQSFEEQYRFGLEVLDRALRGGL